MQCVKYFQGLVRLLLGIFCLGGKGRKGPRGLRGTPYGGPQVHAGCPVYNEHLSLDGGL